MCVKVMNSGYTIEERVSTQAETPWPDRVMDGLQGLL